MNRFAIAAAVAALAAAAFGWSRDGECPFGKIDGDMETPHISFSQNPAKRLKVLVTAWGVGQREVVELKERFDYDPVLLPVAGRDNVSGKERFSPWDDGKGVGGASMTREEYFAEVRKRLAELPTCDAVLVGSTSWDVFPEWVRRPIAERVAEGAGIVLIASRDRLVPFEGVALKEIDPESIFPVSLVPQLNGTRCFAAGYGKGRVLQVVYRLPPNEFVHPYRKGEEVKFACECLTPIEGDHPLYYDFELAFVGKCLWNAVGYRPPPGDCVATTVYDEEGEAIPPGAAIPASARLSLSVCRNGKGQTVDYAVSAVKGAASRAMASLSFDRDCWRPGETISGAVKLLRPAVGELRVAMKDEHGSLVFDRRFPSSGAVDMPFQLSFNHQKSRYARVKAEWIEGGDVRDAKWADLYFNTVDEDRDDFCFTIWSNLATDSRVAKLAHRQMRRLGVDNCMECTYGNTSYRRKFQIPRWVKQTGMNYSTYITYLRGPASTGEGVKDCGAFNGWPDYCRTGKFEVEAKHFFHNETRVMDCAEGCAGLGVYFYNIGDENCLAADLKKENCFCEACQGRFRKYLAREFGSLEGLNAAYGTRYGKWEDVTAYPFMKSSRKRRMPLWADYRAFMEEQFLGMHLLAKAQIEKFDPGAVVGVEGMGPPEMSVAGWNFYRFFPHFRFAAPYFTSREVHAMRYLGPGAVRGAWYGTYEGQMSDAIVRRTPWRFLMYGLNGAFWWAASINNNVFSNATIFRPDLLPLRHFSLSAAEIAAIKESGAGMLMVRARPYDSGVAVHYSNPCLHASSIEPGMTTWGMSIAEFGALLEEASLQYSFICPQELEKGVPQGVKTLVLPFSQAMSDAECAAVRDFVERGGTLVADYMPARLTEHCVKRGRSPIADLFGGKKLVPKPTGHGRAVLTEDFFRAADSRVSMRNAGGLVRGIARYAALGGSRPFAVVEDEYGTICRADAFQNGRFVLVGMLGSVAEAVKASKNAGLEAGMKATEALGGGNFRRISLQEPMYCYDLGRGGRCIGRADVFEIELEPVVGRVLAFAREPVAKPDLRLKEVSVVRGGTLNYSVGDANGCMIAEVSDASGRIVFRDRTFRNESRYVPPYNLKPGNYTITVRSAIGAHSASKGFAVL